MTTETKRVEDLLPCAVEGCNEDRVRGRSLCSTHVLPRIVAECWTCGRLPDEYCERNLHETPSRHSEMGHTRLCGAYAHDPMVCPTTCRAAGHEVREVKR